MGNLQDRIQEYSQLNQSRLMPRLPWIALCNIVAPKKRTIDEKIQIATLVAKFCNSHAFVVFEGDSFAIISKQTQRWESMPGLGYYTRIAGIIASSASRFQLTNKAYFHIEPDIWQIPDSLELSKYLNLQCKNNNNRVFLKKESYVKLTPEQILLLPEKHAARANPELQVKKIVYSEINMIEFDKISHKGDFILNENEAFNELHAK